MGRGGGCLVIAEAWRSSFSSAAVLRSLDRRVAPLLAMTRSHSRRRVSVGGRATEDRTRRLVSIPPPPIDQILQRLAVLVGLDLPDDARENRLRHGGRRVVRADVDGRVGPQA